MTDIFSPHTFGNSIKFKLQQLHKLGNKQQNLIKSMLHFCLRNHYLMKTFMHFQLLLGGWGSVTKLCIYAEDRYKNKLHKWVTLNSIHALQKPPSLNAPLMFR